MKNGPYELVIAPVGYPGKRYRGRYAYEHHVVWWAATGETISAGDVIHHRNGDKRDNRIANLERLNGNEHTGHHSSQRGTKHNVECAQCGETFRLNGHVFRGRRKRSKDGRLYCSLSCGAKSRFSIPGSFNGRTAAC